MGFVVSGTQALQLRGASSVVVVCGLSCPRMRDLNSPTRDQTHIPCIGRRILYHWTTREVLPPYVLNLIFQVTLPLLAILWPSSFLSAPRAHQYLSLLRVFAHAIYCLCQERCNPHNIAALSGLSLNVTIFSWPDSSSALSLRSRSSVCFYFNIIHVYFFSLWNVHNSQLFYFSPHIFFFGLFPPPDYKLHECVGNVLFLSPLLIVALAPSTGPGI